MSDLRDSLRTRLEGDGERHRGSCVVSNRSRHSDVTQPSRFRDLLAVPLRPLFPHQIRQQHRRQNKTKREPNKTTQSCCPCRLLPYAVVQLGASTRGNIGAIVARENILSRFGDIFCLVKASAGPNTGGSRASTRTQPSLQENPANVTQTLAGIGFGSDVAMSTLVGPTAQPESLFLVGNWVFR